MRRQRTSQRSDNCGVKGCDNEKAPGRHVCSGHVEFYDRVRDELASGPSHEVVRRDRVTAADHDPNAAALAERELFREDAYMATRRSR